MFGAFRSVTAINFHQRVESKFRFLIGLTKSQAMQMTELSQQPFNQIVQLLMYCRLGISQRPLGALMDKAQSTISEQLKNTLSSASKKMAEKYLNYSRSSVLDTKPRIIKDLFPDLFAVVDGTYHEIEKSSNFIEQLKSYNSQKCYNLVKTLSLLTVNGRWWDLLGIFYSDGSHNDEMLWEYAFGENLSGFKSV
jgi:hypothetical protein